MAWLYCGVTVNETGLLTSLTWVLGKAMEETQGRMCKPEEVAQAVLFLASQDSSFINGAALYIDNGSSIIG